MTRSGIPFLVGGGYALRHYTGDVRGTKDLDVFVRRRDAVALLDALSAAGLPTELTFPHWLGKVCIEGEHIDVIYSSGNGLSEVDDDWFTHSVPVTVLGIPVRLCPVEEMIWSKAFVMERERYDGADISHLIRACHGQLDWHRLVTRFGPHWRVLLSHLTANIFGRYSVGALSGWIFFSHQVGAALGAAIGGWVFQATGSYTSAFVSAAILAFLAAALALAIKEEPVGRTPRPAPVSAAVTAS